MNGFIYVLNWIVSIANSFFCYCVVGRLLTVKRAWFFKVLLFVGCSLMSDMVIFIGDMVNLPPTLLIFFAAVFLCCENGSLQKMAVGIMIAGSAFGFNALMDTYFYPAVRIDRVVFWAFLLILVYLLIRDADYELTPGYWKLLIFLSLPSLGVVTAVVLMQPYRYQIKGVEAMNQVLLFIALISIIGLLWTMTLMVKFQRAERQRQFYEMSQIYYKNLEQQQFEVRKLRHDMMNHFHTLLHLPLTEKDDYIRELTKHSGISKSMRFCENHVVNIVMNSKVQEAAKDHISIVSGLSVPEKAGVNRVDLCALFGNSLDNAIEACRKLKKQKKEISISASCQKGLLAFQISNPLEEDLEIKNGNIKTSKQDKDRHGYGLESIREISERYDGHMEIQILENTFTLLVWMKEKRTES